MLDGKNREIKFSLPIYQIIERKKKPNKKFLVALNWYRNAHHFENNKIKSRYCKLVMNQAPKGLVFNKVKVSYRVYCRPQIDGGNVRSILEKYFLDALVLAGTIKDDNIKNVIGDDSLYFVDSVNPRIEITVREV